MSETFDKLTTTSVESQEQAVGLIEKLLTVAQPGAVFGEPVVAEGRTIITAAEVNVGLGVGFGFGGGTAASHPGKEGKAVKHHKRGADPHERVEIERAGAEEEVEVEEAASPSVGEDAGMGSGGGGGGGASGRPVAVISVTQDGVQVEPVIDATKVALAFFTTLGSMFFMLAKMRKAAER